MRRRHPYEQHIGDADGRIALWLNEQSAYDLAALFHWPDKGGVEILEAIERAYPPPDEDAPGIAITVTMREPSA